MVANRWRPLCFAVLILFLVEAIVQVTISLGYRLTYQVSPSMKEGWYLIEPVSQIHRHEVLVFYPPTATRTFLTRQHWLPEDGLMMKYVFGMPGDFVCNQQGMLRVNGQTMGRVMVFYAPHKKLPNLGFCEQLSQNHFLMISLRDPHSFDGRYFGPVSRSAIVGQAIEL